MDSIISRIRERFDSLSAAEKQVADIVLGNTREVVRGSVSFLARRSGVGEATVIRFCQSLGLTGYQELKLSLAEELGRRQEISPSLSIDRATGSDESVAEIFNLACTAISKTWDTINHADLAEAAGMLGRARKIDFYGTGVMGYVTLLAKQRFLDAGFLCDAFDNPLLQSTSASCLTRDDVAVGISRHGRAPLVVDALRIAREAGARTICITAEPNSELVKNADKSIWMNCTRDPGSLKFDGVITGIIVCEALLRIASGIRSRERVTGM